MQKFLRALWRRFRDKSAILNRINQSRFWADNIRPFASRRYFGTKENKARVQKVASWLADEESKRTYLKMIDFRQTHNPSGFINHGEENQYFVNDFFKYSEHEVLIDCGAYIGDTIDRFLLLPLGYDKIVAFEPSRDNFEKLSAKHGGNEKIQCINAGVSNFDGYISFAGSGSGFRIIKGIEALGKQSANTIQVRTIDGIENLQKATFIKMDVEGAELDALKGAEKTILRDKPKLAICIYHSDEDMIRLAEYIHNLVPEYKLYVRQHTDCYLETVIYAML